MAGAIERWAVDLPPGEEPARFLAALEGGAVPDAAVPARAASAPPPADLEARSVVARLDEMLERIARLNPSLHAFITVDDEGARRRAGQLDAVPRRRRGPLHGLPIAVKDLCHVPGLPTTCGTKIPHYFTAAAECTVVTRLVAAGAINLGKLNMVELALGAFGDNENYGHVDNPWKSGHSAGGSSSGSAAAVSAGLVFGAVGSDTGGSIRLPAACCGIVGLKPTYGRVSRAGAMPLSWSLDHLGPMTRTVRDAALLLGIMAGHDPRDPTSSHRPVPDYLAGIESGIAGLRIGRPENHYVEGLDRDVEIALDRALAELARLGATVTRLRVPDPQPITDATTIIGRAESLVLHGAILRDRPDDLQPFTRERLAMGGSIPAYDYLQACRLRARLTREFLREVFAEVDLLVVPTTPEPAPSLIAALAGGPGEILQRSMRFARFTRPFNGLGLPVLALPCGFSREDLPLSMSIVGRPFDETTVLRAGYAYQQATQW
ncbi:MAG: amidase [Candidatus Rokubacteria bacterium]|nr:amidase [Candidatus Rokubacteria bacterium]